MKQLEKRYDGSLHATVEEAIEKLRIYKKLGVSHFIFMFQNKEIEQMRLFKEEIMPKI